MQRAIDGVAGGDVQSGSPADPAASGEQLLRAVVATCSDGILAVDRGGRITTWNERLLELWTIPDDLIRTGSAAQVEAFMASQMRDPAAFLRQLRELDASPAPSGLDHLELADGRIYERTTRPHWEGGAVVGRVSGFRDVTRHRHAEDALRISEASYRTIFDLATDAMYVLEPATGAILDVNQRAIELHGLSREDFARLGIRAVSTDEARFSEVAALAYVHQAAAGEPQLFTWRGRHSSGRLLWIEMNLCAAVIGGCDRVLATARDVTHRIEEAAVRQHSQMELERAVSARTAELASAHAVVLEREELYRALADADPDGIVVMDDSSTILSVNPAIETIFGYTPEELIGQQLPILMPEQLREAHRHGVNRYLASGQRGMSWVGVQVPGRRKDGSEVQLEINFGEYRIEGRHCFAGFIRDITDRKQAEEALLFQTTLLAAQNEAAIDGILVAHAGRVLSMNRRYAEIFDVPEELRPLERCDEMLRWAVGRTADPQAYLASIERLRHDPDTKHHDEVLLADGRLLDRYSAPLKSSEGKLYGRIWVVRDITGRKRIEEALQAAKEEAERANLAKSEFLSRMSHELRTPLNSILGFGQMLARRDLPQDQRKSVDHILKAGRHLLSLIDEVLDIARIEANRQQLSLEPVHVRGLLDEALALIRPMAQQRPVHLPQHMAAGLEAHVQADRQRLMQVVLNLLSNAVKYNRPDGSVELLVREAADGEAEGRFTFGVRDTGPGIPPERMGELFVPFARLGAEEHGVEGTGLGLALSQRLVEAMNGELRVESTPGEGSTFWVELPLAQHPLSRPEGYRESVSASIAPKSFGGPRRVLYVEDNLANLNLVESIFEHRPEIQLLTALQGRLGLELAREHDPDLILLDLHLPDMKGEEVLQELRSDPRTSGIPVLVISADATARQIARLRLAGARGYLTKPLDLDEFLAEVDAALADTD